jgi:S-adenosylmethionine:tRNA ribosyltransferase-isomerase
VRVDLFDYALPAERVAQEPRERGKSRLLVLERRSGVVAHRSFAEFPELLRPGDLLVRNDVRVLPARLYGKDRMGRPVEVFLLRTQDDRRTWKTLVKPGRRARPGRTIRLEEDLEGTVEDIQEDGSRTIRFDRPIDEALLDRIGRTPLPPYIRREPGAPDRPTDREAYQTVFAREALAIAAPTAGLHFTEEIVARIRARGVAVLDLTLAIGAGTFKPVIATDTEDHRLPPEEAVIPKATIREVVKAREEGRRVVAVGTTVTRSLEAAVRLPTGPQSQEELRFSADLFITPGFEFRAVDALLTNFHLPRSTLLMLVCAFAGRENVLAAYREAIREEYLFYSFGDAMWIA